ncbi:hypothetical protein D3C85_1137330 [compost metagenome]
MIVPSCKPRCDIGLSKANLRECLGNHAKVGGNPVAVQSPNALLSNQVSQVDSNRLSH